jgi:predicted PurR-regulated permease PerM
MDNSRNNWLVYAALVAAIVASIASVAVPLAALLLGIIGIALAWRASRFTEPGTFNRGVAYIALILSTLAVIFAGMLTLLMPAHYTTV